MTERFVSVVIPTYNRETALRTVLPSYASQPEVKEIIIVDDCSDKPFYEDVKWWKETYGVKLIIVRNKERRGSPYSRNIGFSIAKGNWVLQSDDDVMLEENYIGNVLKSMKNFPDDNVQFGAGLRVALGSKPFKYSDKWVLDPHSFIMRTDWDMGDNYFTPFLNATMLFNSAIPESYLYYDEGLKGNAFREETDLQCRLWKTGIKSVLSPYAICYHLPHKSGGQHQRSRWNYEFWSLRNHFRFLDRNIEFLNEYFETNRSLVGWKLDFIKYCGERGVKLIKRRLRK